MNWKEHDKKIKAVDDPENTDECVRDLDKLNLVKLSFKLKPMFPTAPDALKMTLASKMVNSDPKIIK